MCSLITRKKATVAFITNRTFDKKKALNEVFWLVDLLRRRIVADLFKRLKHNRSALVGQLLNRFAGRIDFRQNTNSDVAGAESALIEIVERLVRGENARHNRHLESECASNQVCNSKLFLLTFALFAITNAPFLNGNKSAPVFRVPSG